MNYSYAHKNTKEGERVTQTSPFNKPRLSAELSAMREEAFKREIPVSDDETLCYLQTLVTALRPKRILELGTAVGISGAAALFASLKAELVTIERDQAFYNEAKQNFAALGLDKRATVILGDAGAEIDKLSGKFDFIFLDCAKVQYVKYLPRLKELLSKGGMLVADDVLLFGYVTGEREVPKKRKMLVEHVKEYIAAVNADKELCTTVINIGNGVAVSVKL